MKTHYGQLELLWIKVIVLLISGSGKSKNVVNAVNYASREIGGLTGYFRI